MGASKSNGKEIKVLEIQPKVMGMQTKAMGIRTKVMEMQAKVMEMQVKAMEMQVQVKKIKGNPSAPQLPPTLNTTSSCSSQPPAARQVGHLAWSRHTIRMRKASQGPAQHNSQGYLADLNNARLEQPAKAATMLTRKSQKYMQK